VNSNDRIALAVGATAGIAVIALLALLRSDSQPRRREDRVAASRSIRYQLERWDNEGGGLEDEKNAVRPEAQAGRHA
jgi:hypothetical protein